VNNSDGDILFVECFDYGVLMACNWESVGSGSNWYVTPLSPEQEELYKDFDFLYRQLLLCSHYKPENIYYLSGHRWADADGDGDYFDIDNVHTKKNCKYAFKNWLKDNSDSNDLNLVYIISHGIFFLGHSLIGVDSNRDGQAFKGLEFYFDQNQKIKDNEVKNWLKNHKYGTNIGRLTFVLETCYAGHFLDALSTSDEKRIIVVTSTKDEPAELETGQDWASFSSTFFKVLGNGSMNVAQAFDIADYHTEIENFMSIYVLKDWGEPYPQDGRLDDNGDREGSSYFLYEEEPPEFGEDGYFAYRTGL